MNFLNILILVVAVCLLAGPPYGCQDVRPRPLQEQQR